MSFERLDGQDIWTFDSVQARYERYCKAYGVDHEALVIRSYSLERNWISGALDVLVGRMKRADLAAAEIGLEMMEADADHTHEWVNWYLAYLLDPNPPHPPWRYE